MKKQPALNWLVPLIAILALFAAGVGLFYQDGGSSYTFITLRDQAVQIYGSGLYRYDTIMVAAGFKGADVVTLVVSLPLLLVSYLLYRRGSLRGGLLLASTLTYFLYIGASMTFSAAFNSLFLVYVALFSTSLFAFIAALTLFDMGSLAERLSNRLPHGGLAAFMFVAGLGTFLLWLSELAGPIMTGQAPENLGSYTTMYTHGFDSAVITPAAVLTGVCLLKRKPLGYLLAAPLLVLCILNGAVVISSGISQVLAGIIFPVGVYIGMFGSWILMGTFAIWLAVIFFRGLAPNTGEQLANRAEPASHPVRN